MKRIGLWIFIFTLLFVSRLFAVGEGDAQVCGGPLPEVVAKVSHQGITRTEIFLRLDHSPLLTQSQDPLKCRQVLEEAVRAALLRPEVHRYQVELTNSEVEAEVEKIRASFPSEEAFKRFLAEREADEATLRKVTEDRLLLKKIEERQIKSWFFAEELQQGYFNEHRSELAKDRIKASHILVKTKEEAERILLEHNLKNLSFSELAVKYSLDERTRQQGGDLGWIERGKMSPEFDAAAFSLAIGSISKPVKSPLGWHLILVEDKKPASEQTLEDHRSKVLRRLQEEEWAFQRESWWNELRGRASIWITPELNPASQSSETKGIHAGHE